MAVVEELKRIQDSIKTCRACTNMCGTPVCGQALPASVLLIGQAPGPHEARLGKPFAYTAGKTLFKWLQIATNLNEDELRSKIYFAAVARCFPGKNAKGAGDRDPSETEILNCRKHLQQEVDVLKPLLILAVGKVAIREVLFSNRSSGQFTLSDTVGKKFRTSFHGHPVDVIALPHPSGVSRWPTTDPGKALLQEALKLIGFYFEKCL